ncbi:MAG: hypothetical protein VW270_08110 [Candidatus Poseidoniales archaeon]
MLKKLLLSAALASLAGYSYSESIAPYSGITPNAAAGGNTWSMDNVLPNGVPGLDINLIIYRYTPQKETADDMTVHIQNENAAGTGYIFRESDDWSGLPGGTEIRKVVPVVPSNRSLWGNGSIEVQGTGTVEEPFVFYNYRVDPCYDPQFDPNCPGYVQPIPEIPVVDIEIYDATEDEYVNLSSEETVLLEENEEVLEELDEEEEEEAEKKKRAYRLAALEASNAAMLFAENQRIQQMNQVAQQAVDAMYMPVTINGGVYKETLVMQDKKLPTNPRGLRNGFAQQLLHEKMVEMQYK